MGDANKDKRPLFVMREWYQAKSLSLDNEEKEKTIITHIIVVILRLKNCGIFLS